VQLQGSIDGAAAASCSECCGRSPICIVNHGGHAFANGSLVGEQKRELAQRIKTSRDEAGENSFEETVAVSKITIY
jgi:hypothetical protein